MNGEQPINVHAHKTGAVWQYSYAEPCANCGRIHRHGGGTGDLPDLAVGETGGWLSHCPADGLPVTLRLDLIFLPPEDEPLAVGTARERGIAATRQWRERTMFACAICPPLADGELKHHRTPTFHQALFTECAICTPPRPGVPRRHLVKRPHPRRAIRHVITAS
jgi:hypothetical protein